VEKEYTYLCISTPLHHDFELTDPIQPNICSIGAHSPSPQGSSLHDSESGSTATLQFTLKKKTQLDGGNKAHQTTRNQIPCSHPHRLHPAVMGIGPFTKHPTANGSHQASMRWALAHLSPSHHASSPLSLSSSLPCRVSPEKEHRRRGGERSRPHGEIAVAVFSSADRRSECRDVAIPSSRHPRAEGRAIAVLPHRQGPSRRRLCC